MSLNLTERWGWFSVIALRGRDSVRFRWIPARGRRVEVARRAYSVMGCRLAGLARTVSSLMPSLAAR